jgi:hypothetical protein
MQNMVFVQIFNEPKLEADFVNLLMVPYCAWTFGVPDTRFKPSADTTSCT